MIVGWSEHVTSVRERFLFWHRIWDSCGRARSGIVADCMRRTRVAYHYAVRMVKRNEEQLHRERFSHCVLNNDSRSFRTEVKKIRANKSGRCRIVDGKNSDDSVADVFLQSYKKLFTSVPYDKSTV